jgi:hypothetical protein
VVFAVNICEVATPLELVVSVSVTPGVVVAKVPLAPVPGAVNVTVTPLAGVVPDITVATRGFVNGAPTTALCPPPLVAAIVMAGGVFVELELQATRAAIMPRPMKRRIDLRNVIAHLR